MGEKSRTSRPLPTGTYLAIGIALGTAFGLLFDQMVIGLALGLIFGVSADRAHQRRSGR